MLLTDELLLNYKRCQRRAFLNVYGNFQEKDPEKDFLVKLRRENDKQIQEILSNQSYQQPRISQPHWQTEGEETEALMAQGVECIYQGVLVTENPFNSSNLTKIIEEQKRTKSRLNKVIFYGNPTLLVKKEGNSRFGNWLYYPINIKLGRRPKPEYKLIAAFHAQLLAKIQGCLPPISRLILRHHHNYDVPLGAWLVNLREIVTECLQMLAHEQEPEVFISRQRCSLCPWYSHCYNIAQQQKHLSLVPGITPKRYASLQGIGVETVTSLADACVINMGEVMGVDIAHSLQQQAQSIVNNKAILKVNTQYKPKIPLSNSKIELYFDIEAESELKVDFLLGVLVVDHEHNSTEFYALLAEKPEQEREIWLKFIDLINFYPDAPIFHFSEYETETVKRLAQLYKTPLTQKQAILSRLVDIHAWVTQTVVLPVESYSLKTLANWLGFQWRDPEGIRVVGRSVGGDQCIYWYDQWLDTGNRAFIESILRYNEDDCRATYRLKTWLFQFLTDSLRKS